MRVFRSFLIPIIAAACFHARADDGVSGAARKLPGWGVAVDPDGDCKFLVTMDSLLISVPGSDRAHDLAADIDTINAPRVLRQANGDFTMQVRVDGRFEPGNESTKPGRKGYQGAGIIAMLDYRNVVTLARAALQSPGEGLVPYANFEIRVDGALVEMGQSEDHPLPADGPVYLRLERRGSKFLGSVSTDGVKWDELASKDVPATWPQSLKAGLVAISTSRDVLIPRFSKFQVLKFSAPASTPVPAPTATPTATPTPTPATTSTLGDSSVAEFLPSGHRLPLLSSGFDTSVRFGLFRNASDSASGHREAGRLLTTITLAGTIDGSEQFRFAPGRIQWTHKFWSAPADMTFCGQPWLDLNATPALWRKGSADLDLSRAHIIQRSGRDIIALEPTQNGFILTLSDSPNGADAYSVTIAIPVFSSAP